MCLVPAARQHLPKKLCSTSRCYRGEVSTFKEEKGLYRVHQFTKVEMFGLTEGSYERSQELQQEFLQIEMSLFADLGLHFRVLDMPPADLGDSAYRKFDIEAWMSGHGFYGKYYIRSKRQKAVRTNILYSYASRK